METHLRCRQQLATRRQKIERGNSEVARVRLPTVGKRRKVLNRASIIRQRTRRLGGAGARATH